MAAGGFKEFQPNEILDEDDINDFLMQGVLVFANSTARGSAIPSPVEGQFSFLTNSNTMQFYDGSAWKNYTRAPNPAVVSSTTTNFNGAVGTATVGADTVYTFTNIQSNLEATGSMIFSSAGVVDVLVVGAGGPGGAGVTTEAGGGGGGGGVVEFQNFYVTAGTVTLSVGALDDSNSSNLFPGASNFGSLVAGAGGAAGEQTFIGTRRGTNGASGGGGYGDSVGFAGGAGVMSVQGNNGGAGFGSGTTNARAGGGGGGAGGAGAGATSAVGGNGGAGVASSITGSSVVYGAGGGGAVLTAGATPGTGGSGIGGNGGAGAAGANASPANRGAGGGGSGTSAVGGLGSAGVVIVRVKGS
jgi:hypothetical protein